METNYFRFVFSSLFCGDDVLFFFVALYSSLAFRLAFILFVLVLPPENYHLLKYLSSQHQWWAYQREICKVREREKWWKQMSVNWWHKENVYDEQGGEWHETRAFSPHTKCAKKSIRNTQWQIFCHAIKFNNKKKLKRNEMNGNAIKLLATCLPVKTKADDVVLSPVK